MFDLNRFKGSFSTYGEIRFHENRDLALVMLNGQLTSNAQITQRGVSARAFENGYWGFSSHSTPTQPSMERALKEATDNARFLGRHKPRKVHLASAHSQHLERSFGTTKSKRPLADWLDFVKGVDQLITTKFTDIKSRMVRLMALDMEKHLLTSEGVESHTLIPRAHLTVSMTKDSSFGPVTYHDVRGGLGHLEDQFTSGPESLLPWLTEIYETVSKKTTAVPARAGQHDVILNSDLAGILAHEAVGHTTEADLVLGGSVAGENLGQRVASDLVTLVDFAHTARGETCPQPIFIDDEGTQAEDTVIIENGILKTFMNNKETAAHFGQKATGHARAFKYSDEPLIRMRNTAILPGRNKLEELIASIDQGYLLMSPGNGQADTTGEFMFAVNMGYEIKGGKLGQAIRDTTISGVAFDMLKNVTMVSDEFEWVSSGYCGKKQPMPVGMGGPSIKSRVHIGGQ